MLEVAGEGRGGEAEPGPQGAEGETQEEGLVDFGQRGVIADSTTLVHGLRRFLVFSFWFLVKESGQRLSGEGAKGQQGWEK